MPTIGELAVNINARTGPFSKAMDKARQKTQQFSKSVVGSANGALSKLSGALSSTAARLGALAGVGGLGLATVNSLKLAAAAEQAAVAFKVLTGSATKAQQTLKKLRDFSNATPFEFREITEAGKKLLAFGTTTEDLLPALKAIGDVAAGLGIPFGELSEIYGKIKVQGRLYQEDINQLQGRGIPVVQALAKAYGKTNAEIKTMVTNGKVGFTDVQLAFEAMTEEGGQFFNMMEQQSQTLGGAFSTLKSNITSLMTDIGASIASSLNLTEHIQQVNEYFKAWDKGRGPIAAWFEDFKGVMLTLEEAMLRQVRKFDETARKMGFEPRPNRNLADNLRQQTLLERQRAKRRRDERQALVDANRAAQNKPATFGAQVGFDILDVVRKANEESAKAAKAGVGSSSLDLMIAGIVRDANKETARFGDKTKVGPAGQLGGAKLAGSAAAASSIAKAQANKTDQLIDIQRRALAELERGNNAAEAVLI